MKDLRRWLAGFLSWVLLGAAAFGGPQSIEGRPAQEWGPLPQDLARVLEAKADGYGRRALSFSCLERVRTAQYSEGTAEKESWKDFDYLLIKEAGTLEGFRALRYKPGGKDPISDSSPYPFPEPFLWSLVFEPRISSTLRFKVGTWRTTPWKLAIPIEWSSSAPVSGQQHVTEWSGTAEVEFRTGNLLRIVARPSLQEERLQAQLERFQTAFRLFGFSLAPAPIGSELTVDFDFEHEGYSFPTRVELTTYRLLGFGQRAIVKREVVEFLNYRFFGSQAEEHIPPLTWHPPGIPLSGPLPQPPAP